MAILSARFVRRSLELFALLSLAVLIGIVIYSDNAHGFLRTMLSLNMGWVALAIAMASFDWVGGGLRLWVATRHVHRSAPLGGMILAAGMNTWAGYLTPSQTGGGPVMIWVMKQHGVPYPEATSSSFITFVATILFFAIAGPLALVFGAGLSLGEHGVVLGITVLDLFRATLGVFVVVALVLIALLAFPGRVRDLLHRLTRVLGGRWPRLQQRLEGGREGIDRAHACLVAFFRGRGWLAVAGAVLLTGVAFANRLLGGYVILRALGIHAHFVDVLLLQTLITFLLYFAPTPGGSGMAEILGAAVMSIYVPRELIPSYTVLWRLTTSYITVAAGSVVFWLMLRRRLGTAAEVEDLSAVPYG